MAYLPQEDEEEQLSTAALGQQGATTPSVGPTQTYNPSSSSRFTNFGDYFRANNGAGMGDSLVSGLEGAATAAGTGAQKAAGDVKAGAAAGTVQGPAQGTTVGIAPPPSVVPATPPRPRPTPAQVRLDLGVMAKSGNYTPTPAHVAGTLAPAAPAAPAPSGPVISRGEAEGMAGRTYSGPSEDDVEALFAPLQRDATRATQNISTARDAAGVKAVQGGTGFEATLAHAGAGGRLPDLRAKYGSLAGDVRTARGEASQAVGQAARDSGVATEGYRGLVGDFDAEQGRLAQERAEKDVKYQRGQWRNATANTAGGKLGSYKAVETRPTGEQWLDFIDPGLRERNPGTAYVGGSFLRDLGLPEGSFSKMAKTFDLLTEEEALQATRLVSRAQGADDYIPLLEYLNKMAQKYGVY